jgi:exonuclease VII large subunit
MTDRNNKFKNIFMILLIMVDENLSELEKMLKRAQIDEEYRRDNKNYLEEAKRLYNEILKRASQAKTPLELLFKRINSCDLCDKGEESGVFKASIMEALREYVEEIDPTKPDYKQKVDNLKYSMLYLSTKLAFTATYTTFLEKLQNNLSKYDSLEEAYKWTSEYIKSAIRYLLEDPKGHEKRFEEYMQVDKLLS